MDWLDCIQMIEMLVEPRARTIYRQKVLVSPPDAASVRAFEVLKFEV